MKLGNFINKRITRRRESRTPKKNILTSIARAIINICLVFIGLFTLVIYTPFFSVAVLEWFAGNQVFRVGLLFIDFLLLLHYLSSGKWRWIIPAGLFFLVLLIESICYIPITGNTYNGSRADRIRVLTFNTRFFFPKYYLNTLKSEDIDLACFQEVKENYIPAVLFNYREGRKNNYCGWYGEIAPGADTGLLMVSREPIELVEQIRCPSFRDKERYAYIVKTKLRGKVINIIGLHLEPVNLNGGIMSSATSWKMRLRQARRIAASARRLEGPVIIVGDLNSTPTDRVYRTLKRDFRDTGREAGKLFGSTWHQDFPLFRIDYILYKDFKAASDARIFRMGRSDHMVYSIDLHY